MLELYHTVNSVCAQKVRIALYEKGLDVVDRMMTLRGDQNDPDYLKLNPNGVVPTLVHDGHAIIESSAILYYIEDAFPEPALQPKDPLERYQVRMYNRIIDDYIHKACMIITFATSLRPAFLAMPPEFWEMQNTLAPLQKLLMPYKKSALKDGLDSEYVPDALSHYTRLLLRMEMSLKQSPYLGGAAFSLADCCVVPYLLRLELLNLSGMWAKSPEIADWWSRMRARASVKTTVLDRMSDADKAPYKNLSPDPWPKVEALLQAA